MLRRSVLWWVVVSLAVLGTLVGIALWRAHGIADETIERHRARLSAERAAIAAFPRGRPALLEPSAGEATAVVEEFLAAVEAVPSAERDRLIPSSGVAVVPEEADAALASNPQPLAVLERILYAASVLPPPSLDLDALGAATPARLEGSMWLAAAGERAVARGEATLGLRIAALQAAFANEILRGGTLFEDLVGSAVAAKATRHLVAVLALGPVDAAEARRLGSILDRLEAHRVPLEAVISIERAYGRSRLASQRRFPGEPEDEIGWRWLWSRRICIAEALDLWDETWTLVAETLADAETNPTRAIARARAAAEESDNPFVRDILKIVPLWIGKRAQQRAHLRVTRTALAVAEFAARRGALPSSVAELVPELLPSVPMDPWDGKPLRYSGGTVWSVGANGRDEAGMPPASPDDVDSGDVVVVVPAPGSR